MEYLRISVKTQNAKCWNISPENLFIVQKQVIWFRADVVSS